MISFATAGPTSRTKRVVDATPSGTPRSTSGIHISASAAAHRKSHASVSPQPPPTAWPLIIAIVICSRFSSTVFARSKSRRNWLFRPVKIFRRSSGDILELIGASAPAEKIGGAPVTITTLTSASSRSAVKTAPSSVSIGSLSELRRSGRFRVTVAIGPSRSIFTFSMTRGPYHTADERRKRGRRRRPRGSALRQEVGDRDTHGREREERRVGRRDDTLRRSIAPAIGRRPIGHPIAIDLEGAIDQ